MSRKVVIVGGVAGGATAAARIRRLDEHAEIIVFERSGYISYANCGLPYYVGGVITDPEELTLQDPESFYSRFRVVMKVHHDVTALHPERKTVSVTNLETGESFEESYDSLILAPGARPTVPDLPGIDSERIFKLRTVEDTFALREVVAKTQPKRAAVIGGGFIGLEVAENLRHAGVEAAIIQRPKQVLSPIDPEMAAFIHGELRANGVQLLLGRSVVGFETDEKEIRVLLKDEPCFAADLVVLAIGVQPESALARDAGLELGVKGSILVNDRMETSVKDIYAVGDAVQVRHFVSDEPALIALAGPANKQGRIAADNICGLNSTYKGSQGSSVIKLFGLTAASTGMNEKALKASGLDYDKIYLSPMSHAGYYPGGEMMTMKVLFEKGSNRLLGAQIVGGSGVDKRLDVLATALRAGVSVIDLKDLDLAYAPPYSSAKDPVNMAGFMAENLIEGRVKQFYWDELDGLARDGSLCLVDVRTPGEYDRGHAEGAINIPVDDLRDRLSELPKEKPLYLICQSALRSYIACRILEQEGFDCRHLAGGWRLYSAVKKDAQAAKTAAPCGKEN